MSRNLDVFKSDAFRACIKKLTQDLHREQRHAAKLKLQLAAVKRDCDKRVGKLQEAHKVLAARIAEVTDALDIVDPELDISEER